MKIITEPEFYESFLESTGLEFPRDSSDIKNIDPCFRLEGVSVYLKMIGPEDISRKYQDCPKSFVNVVYKSRSGKNNPTHYITTDLLTLCWCDWLDDLKYLSSPDPSHHEPRIKIQGSFDGVSKLGDTGDTYVAFLSDWVELGIEELTQELENHGYRV